MLVVSSVTSVSHGSRVTRSQLESLADEQEWTCTDQQIDEEADEWAYTFETPQTNVTIAVDSTTHVGDTVVNNILIQSPLLRCTTVVAYGHLRAIALRDGLGLKLFDNQADFPRAAASPEAGADSYPTLRDVAQLLTESDEVSVRLIARKSSTEADCDDICYWVSRISTATQRHHSARDENRHETSYL